MTKSGVLFASESLILVASCFPFPKRLQSTARSTFQQQESNNATFKKPLHAIRFRSDVRYDAFGGGFATNVRV